MAGFKIPIHPAGLPICDFACMTTTNLTTELAATADHPPANFQRLTQALRALKPMLSIPSIFKRASGGAPRGRARRRPTERWGREVPGQHGPTRQWEGCVLCSVPPARDAGDADAPRGRGMNDHGQ